MALHMKKPVTGATGRKVDFPALANAVNGRAVAYLDSASSAQKPQAVVDAMTAAMTGPYANVHRGVYAFAAQTTQAFESARATTAKFLNAKEAQEIVFTRNGTEAINLVAATFGASLQAGDEIIITDLEHHANIVPWHLLKEKKGIVLRSAPLTAGHILDVEALLALITPRTKLVAVTHMSNVLGTIVPVERIVAAAHAAGAKVLVDGCQAVAHMPVDVRAIGCDFYVFTGHKLYGPTGIGVLYGRYGALLELPPYQGGGEMIETVSPDRITFKDPPYRFEAGTPPIIEAIGLAAAIDYVMGLNENERYGHARDLAASAERRLREMPGVTLYSAHSDILSFNIEGVHPHDAATVFDQIGLCLRAGHHCAQPLMRVLGVPATLRASFALYNTVDDVDRLVEGVEKTRKLFS